MGSKNRKDDLLIVRIEKKLKSDFTTLNKKNKVKNSQKIRAWIKDYLEENNTK